jgi:hypothetical protein
MTTAVEALVREFLEGGWKYVTELQDVKAEERIHLEFKLTDKPETGAVGRKDKELLSKALSGFANAQGGLIVWGVDCRKDRNGLDRVVGISPIKDARFFRSQLENITPHVVYPPLDNVNHNVITEPNSDTGIVLTAIPRSERIPHRAVAEGLHQYFKRYSTSFLVMSHDDLADMFGRRPHPTLEVALSWKIRRTRIDRHHAEFILEVYFRVRNTGRALASLPCLTIRRPEWGAPEFSPKVGAKNAPLGMSVPAPAGWWARLVGGPESVLYPGDEYEVCTVWFRFGSGEMPDDIFISFEAIAVGCPVLADTYKIDLVHTRKAVEMILNKGPVEVWSDDVLEDLE